MDHLRNGRCYSHANSGGKNPYSHHDGGNKKEKYPNIRTVTPDGVCGNKRELIPYLHCHGANNRKINPYLHRHGICLQALGGRVDIDLIHRRFDGSFCII
jgi:hypothetical protein